MVPREGLGEEFGEVTGGQAGGFFGDEMPRCDGSAAHLPGPGFPYLQRLVPAGDRAGFTPEDQRGAGDQTAPAVGLQAVGALLRFEYVGVADRSTLRRARAPEPFAVCAL